MGALTKISRADSIAGQRLQPGDALWHYAPTHGVDGRAVSDFMMLVPGFRRASTETRGLFTAQLQRVFRDFENQIVFADLNLRLGILWVTVNPQPGLCGTIAAAIQDRLPGAKLVGTHFQKPTSRLGRLANRVRSLLT